jgi:hypothetical protein
MASLVELMRTLPVDEAEALLQKYEAELAAPPEEPAPDFSTGWEVARTPIEEQAYQRYLDYRNPPAPEEEPIEDPGFLRRAGDIGVKYGAMIPKTYAGLLSLAGDIPGVNVVADPLARGLYKSADVAEELLLSDYQRGKERELQSAIEAASMQLGPDATFDDYLSQFQAQGGAVLDYLQENPAQVLPMITESIAALRTGARTLRGVEDRFDVLQKQSPLARMATSAGLTSAGDVTYQIAQEDQSGAYRPERLLGIPAGATVGLTTLGGGKVAERLGMADFDTVVARNLMAGQPANVLGKGTTAAESRLFTEPFGPGVASRLAGRTTKAVTGGGIESLEEMPQSAVERMMTNIGTGRSALEGLGADVTLGGVLGFVQGGGSTFFRSPSDRREAPAQAPAAAPAQPQIAAAEAEAQSAAEQQRLAQEEAMFAEREAQLAEQERLAKSEERRQYFPTFVSFDDYTKQRQQERLAELDNEATELGAAFAEWQVRNEIYDRTDKTKKAFLKEFLNKDEDSLQAKDEYMSLFDEHIQVMKTRESRSPEANAELDSAAESLLKRLQAVENAQQAAQIERQAQSVMSRAEWNYYKRLAAQPTVGAPTGTQTQVTGDGTDTKAAKQTKQQASMARATELLGENWEETYPELSALSGDPKSFWSRGAGRASKFDTMLDQISKETSVETAADVLDQVDLKGNQRRLLEFLLEKAKLGTLTDYMNRPETVEGKKGISDGTTETGNFSPVAIAEELKITDRNGNEVPAAKAARDYIKKDLVRVVETIKQNRGLATALANIQSKRRVVGGEEETAAGEIEAMVSAAGQEPSITEMADEEAQKGVIELGDEDRNVGVSIVRSAGDYASQETTGGRGVNVKEITRGRPAARNLAEAQRWLDANPDLDLDPNTVSRDEVDPVAVKRAQEANAKLDASDNARIRMANTSGELKNAAKSWANYRADIDFNALTNREKVEWMESVNEFNQTGDEALLSEDADEIAAKYEGVTDEQRRATETETMAEAEGEAPARGAGRGAGAVKGAAETTEAELPEGVSRYSIGDTVNAARAAYGKERREAIERAIETISGDAKNAKVKIYDTLADAIAGRLNGEFKTPILDGTAAFVEGTPGKTAMQVFFIAENVKPGEESGVLLHEVGVHMGMESIFSEQQISRLVDKIQEWSLLGDESTEHLLALRTAQRIENARAQMKANNLPFDKATENAEWLAYFVEESINAGINPTTVAKNTGISGQLREFIRGIYSAFKKALRRFNMNPDSLTGRDIVDMAYGAARMELNGVYHGTAAVFRRFDHRFMSSGEGAQAYGWGTYLAEKFGIGRDYYYQDMSRKGRLDRVAYEELQDNPDLWETRYVYYPGTFFKALLENGSGPLQNESDAYARLDRLIANVEFNLKDYKNYSKDAPKSSEIKGELADNKDEFGNVVSSKEYYETEVSRLTNDLAYLEAVRDRKLIRLGAPGGGSLFRVDTTVANDELLDWDKSIKDQPKVLAALKKMPEFLQEAVFEDANVEGFEDSNLTGRNLYFGLANQQLRDYSVEEFISEEQYNLASMGHSDKVVTKGIVSQYLDNLGIKGIRYLDASSRKGPKEKASRNRVIFNEDNVIIVGRQPDARMKPGEFRYSLSEDYVAKNYGETAADVYNSSSSLLKKAARSVKFLHQFIRDVKDDMPAAEAWHRAVLSVEMTRNEIRQMVESIAVRARELDPARLDVVNDFIGDSTFDQKWGYDPNFSRLKDVKIDSDMRARFNALSAEEQQLVKDVFQHGENMITRMREDAKRLGVDDKFFKTGQLQGPYAPLKRFGRYMAELKSAELVAAERRYAAAAKEDDKETMRIIGKEIDSLKSSEANYVFSTFDTVAAAKRFARENRANYAQAIAGEKRTEAQGIQGADYKTYQKVLASLNADENSAMDPASKRMFQDMVKDLYFNSLDETNARQSGRRRKARAGYEKNMIRSFLEHAKSQAALVANMEHGAQVNEAYIQAREQSKGDPELTEVFNMISRHYQDSMNFKETPIQDRFAAANTVYMLTTSIGYHVTNFTQAFMVALPKIAGQFGNYSNALNALMKGYEVAMKSGMVKVDWANKQVLIDPDKAPPRYQKLLKELQLLQLLDVGIENDLSELSRHDYGYEPVNKISDIASKWTHRLYQISRWVEAQNRVSSAVAAYDMALANPSKLRGMTPEEYAVSVVEDTQGNFSRIDAPLLLKTLPGAKIVGQYRKYQIMMGWMYATALKQASRGMTAEEKAIGRRTLAYALGHAGIFAGATGLPIAGIVTAFLALSGEGDEPEDLERWIKRNVKDEDMATLLSRGVFGWMGVDMGSKLSQANIFHPLPYTDFDMTQDGVKSIVYDAVMGPSGATVKNFLRSFEYAKEGNVYKSIEYAMPKGLRNAAEALRVATEGYTLRNGDVIADPRSFDWRLIFDAVGLPSSQLRDVKWTRGQQYELEKYFDDRSSMLRKDYLEAFKAKNTTAQKRLRDEWMELQNEKDRVRPFFNDPKAIRRQSVGVLLSYPAKQRKREQEYRRQAGN